jgi:aarF domain-containing kinase
MPFCLAYPRVDIDGGRVDNLEYLKKHNISRNQVSQELARIFSQMVYEHGFFHADPHAGNLLIRPKVEPSRSPFNFEVALLDHGQLSTRGAGVTQIFHRLILQPV